MLRSNTTLCCSRVREPGDCGVAGDAIEALVELSADCCLAGELGS